MIDEQLTQGEVNVQRGDDMRDKRKRLGYSKYKIAAMADCSPAYISMLEDGYRPKSTSPKFGAVLSVYQELEANHALKELAEGN